ncbi:MAG TPA: energy transducer TonB [Steroidobacteraceae bacterium]|nr:energy transducer TonB [Steroidobacteraceae bacterium]
MKPSAAKALRSTQVNTIAPAPSGAGIDVLVVTEDDFFLLAVRRVVTLPNRVWHATSETQAADMLLSSPCAVALIDLALVQSQLEQVMTRLRQVLPDLGFVAAGEPEEQTRLTRFLHNGELQGFIAKADAAEKLAGVLEAGINRHLELKSDSDAASTAASRSGRGPMYAAIGSAVVVVAVLAGWLLMRGGSEDSVPVDASTAGSAATGAVDPAVVVETELQKARDAFEAGRYIDPKAGGALEHYKLALAADPASGEARDGVHRVAEVMLARAEAALLDQRTRDAVAAIKLTKSIEPTHPRIAVLEAQIAREADRTQSAQQEQARADAASQKLASLIKLGNDRLGQDKLIEPTGDSARYYFTTARELDSGSSLPQQGLRSLANKMLQKSSVAATRGDIAEAEQWLTQARQLGVSGVDFAKAERDLKNGQRARSGEADRLAGLARERLAAGQLIAPEADSALFYVQALKSQYPSYAGLGPVTDSLRAQLLTGAEDAATRKDVAVAQKMLDEARGMGASGAGLEAATAAVSKAKRKADAVAKPQPVRDDMVVKSVTPEYPAKAQRRRVEGYVDLHFTTNETGEVVDVSVAKAEPAEVFDDAAIRALKKWKFKPLIIDGEPTSQRLALRMRFAMTE